MWSYFTFKCIAYNIRNGQLLKLPDAKSVLRTVFSVPIQRHKSRLSHVNVFYAIMEDN